MLFDKMKWHIMRFSWEGGKDLICDTTDFVIGLPDFGEPVGYLTGIEGRVVTAFAGITGPVTMKVGFTSCSDALIQAVDLSVAQEFVGAASLDHKFFCTRRSAMYDPEFPIVTFTSASGNLEDLTAGKVEIVVFRVVPDVG